MQTGILGGLLRPEPVTPRIVGCAGAEIGRPRHQQRIFLRDRHDDLPWQRPGSAVRRTTPRPVLRYLLFRRNSGAAERGKAHFCDAPVRAGDPPARADDLPERADGVPERTDDVPARADDVPARANDLPERANDPPA